MDDDDRSEPLNDEERLERAVQWLKREPAFRCVSRRLLADMLVTDGFQKIDPAEIDPRRTAILVLTNGGLRGFAGPGETFTFLPEGAYLSHDLEFARFTAPPAGRPIGVHITWEEFRALPPALLSSIHADGLYPHEVELVRGALTPEAIWVTCDPDLAFPMLPLAFALAEAVAKDTQRPTCLIAFKSGKAIVHKWLEGRLDPPMPLAPLTTIGDLCEWLGPDATAVCRIDESDDMRCNGRIFVVNVDAPATLPDAYQARFHRVVYLTDRMPRRAPPFVLARLIEGRKGDPAHHACFNATIVGAAGRVADDGHDDDADGFAVTELRRRAVSHMRGTSRPRIVRDACRLQLDMNALRTRWSEPPEGGDFGSLLDEADRRRIARWARTVTFRRVGLAISGGGAAAYRAAELFAALEEADVPVDVVTGLSGGALIGAYYCWGGRPAVDTAIERGTLFQLVLPVVVATSAPLEMLVDNDVGSARVEDMETRYVPIATRLAPGEEPQSVAIVGGTLGRAVRASGCLPPTFAPAWLHDARYTDGGASTVVPARVARDFGADVVLACNVIPGVERSNPFDDHPLGRLLHRYTPVGRVIDLYAWYSHFWSEISRQFGEDADVYLEFERDSLPFLESFEWWNARGIARRARHQHPRVARSVAKLKHAWERLQKRPET
jgi:predicted patatin/cPLA2 family phospholipase